MQKVRIILGKVISVLELAIRVLKSIKSSLPSKNSAK